MRKLKKGFLLFNAILFLKNEEMKTVFEIIKNDSF